MLFSIIADSGNRIRYGLIVIVDDKTYSSYASLLTNPNSRN